MEAPGQPRGGQRSRARVRATTRGQSARGAPARPARAPAGAAPAAAAGAEPGPGRGGAEPRGILESAGRWGFWEESSISSFPPPRPSAGTPNFDAPPPAAGECWACTCPTGSP